MKSKLLVIVMLTVCIGFGACSGNEPGTDPPKKSDKKEITSFKVNNEEWLSGSTISKTFPCKGTNVSNLIPTITHTGVSISPASGVSTNFSSPVTYTVTAEDGSTKSYTVNVTVGTTVCQ